MNAKELVGTWEGFSTYGTDYPKEYQTIKEPFTLTLTIKDDILSGKIVDSFVEKFFDEPATVEGTCIGGSLSLIKRYPCFLGLDENDKAFIDKSLASDEIHFVGTVKEIPLSDEILVEGTWDISGSFRDDEGRAIYYTHEGKWKMHLIS